MQNAPHMGVPPWTTQSELIPGIEPGLRAMGEK